MDNTEACHYSTDNNTSKHNDGILLHIIHGLESLYNPPTEIAIRGESMKTLRKVLELISKATEAIVRKLPPYPIDPLYPWIIIWLILPLLLSLIGVM